MSVIDTSDPTCGTVTCLCTGRVLHCCLHSCSWGLTSWHRVRVASLQLVTGTSSAVVVHLVRGATSHLATGLCTCAHHLTLNTAPAPALHLHVVTRHPGHLLAHLLRLLLHHLLTHIGRVLLNIQSLQRAWFISINN